MNFRRPFKLTALAIAVLAFAQFAYAQTAGDGKIANMTVGASSVRWDILVPNSGGAVTISFPDGRSVKKAFRAGGSPEFDLSDKQLDSLPDGVYNYDLRLAPVLAPGQKETMMKARGEDDDPEAQRNLRKRPAVPSLNQNGSFAIVNGALVGPGGIEGERTGANTVKPQPAAKPATAARVSENTITRLRNHRFSLMAPFDIVHADDVIIQGSLCVGLDCVSGESFGFDTIRLKENNTRIKFDDTSVSAGFPANDWQLTANDSASGGSSKFSIEDITGSKVPFTITAGATTNSLFVSSSGKIGNKTSTPVLDFHITTGDTPAIRQEQTNAGGFTAQTWDIGANEANWFVRDVTSGSRLPFRIRPGAPTSSIDISATGLVGVGTASPQEELHLFSSTEARMMIDGPAATSPGLEFGSAGTEKYIIYRPASTDDLRFYNAGDKVTFLSGGNVGIGTTAPTQLLSVNGTAGKPGGGTWDVFSDERLKNIKGNFTPGLSAVMRLQPLRYQYKAGNALSFDSNKEYVGFGAQELQKVLPEAVSRNANGYLQVSSDPILWTMLNAIKEQQKQIEQLKGEIRKLRTAPHKRRK